MLKNDLQSIQNKKYAKPSKSCISPCTVFKTSRSRRTSSTCRYSEWSPFHRRQVSEKKGEPTVFPPIKSVSWASNEVHATFFFPKWTEVIFNAFLTAQCFVCQAFEVNVTCLAWSSTPKLLKAKRATPASIGCGRWHDSRTWLGCSFMHSRSFSKLIYSFQTCWCEDCASTLQPTGCWMTRCWKLLQGLNIIRPSWSNTESHTFWWIHRAG